MQFLKQNVCGSYGKRFFFENLDLNRCVFCCSGGPVHPPLDPIWAPRGCDQKFRGPRGALLGRAQKPKAPPGGAFGRPEVAPEGLGAILEMLKKRLFLYCFEPLDRSSGAQGAKKGPK